LRVGELFQVPDEEVLGFDEFFGSFVGAVSGSGTLNPCKSPIAFPKASFVPSSSRTRFLSAGHVPTLSWNQIQVEVTLLDHPSLLPERPLSHWLRSKPFLPRPVRLHVILMHQIPDLIAASPTRTNSHGCSCTLQSPTDSQAA
jgi:hypothetical protein